MQKHTYMYFTKGYAETFVRTPQFSLDQVTTIHCDHVPLQSTHNMKMYLNHPGCWVHQAVFPTPRVGFRAHVCYHFRISPPRLLAECRKRRLNQGSLVLLFFRFSTLFYLYLVFVCLFSCTVFVLSFCMFIFLYCCVCQYQSSHWLWRPPPKRLILCRVGR